MKYQGTLVNWDDKRGFGFVTPKSGGERAFVHIKAFTHNSRRPLNGDLINYRVIKDTKGKLKATDVVLVKERAQTGKAKSRPSTRSASKASSAYLPLLLAFFTLLGGLITFDYLPIEILYVYLIASLIAFVLYARDKSAAQNNRWRTPESHLQLAALLGGWPGAYLAQQRLRHKSAKRAFKTVFWFTVLFNLAALAYLLTDAGHTQLKHLVG